MVLILIGSILAPNQEQIKSKSLVRSLIKLKIMEEIVHQNNMPMVFAQEIALIKRTLPVCLLFYVNKLQTCISLLLLLPVSILSKSRTMFLRWTLLLPIGIWWLMITLFLISKVLLSPLLTKCYTQSNSQDSQPNGQLIPPCKLI